MKRRAKSSAAPARLVLEATIAELAPGGDGVAIAEIDQERRAIFVRGVAVGDRLKLEIDRTTRPARGAVLELMERGPARVASPCAHVARCGGCDWMHLDPGAQLAAHVAHVRASLPAPFLGAAITSHPAPANLAYRARARIHARVSGGRAIVGMNEARSHEPAEVDTCVVLDPTLDAARGRLAAILDGAHGRGDAQFALGAPPDRRPVLDLTWTGSLPAEVFARLERAVAANELAGVRVFTAKGTRPAVIGDPTPWTVGADGAPLRLAPGSFGQANEAMNVLLGTCVAELASSLLPADPATRRIVELYAGAGNLTVSLARLGADLVAVESNKEACEAARANLEVRGLRARVVQDDATTYAPSQATRLIVLDPPRTGAREVTAKIAATRLRAVIYVSCDPQTLGRDLGVLEAAGYTPRAIEVFEMFPQTSHVETVIALERAR